MKHLSAALFGVLAAAMLSCSLALADATPIELVLLYMPNVSNTDTPAASGIAELVMPEGEVRITATGLPRLDGQQTYVAWVVNSQSNQFLRLGAFNAASATESVHYEQVLPDAIPNKQWNLLLITQEDSATPAHPSSKHSIAGVFPRGEQEQPPAVLPNTGGADDALPPPNRPDWLPVAGLAALTLSGGLGAGYVLGQRKR